MKLKVEVVATLIEMCDDHPGTRLYVPTNADVQYNTAIVLLLKHTGYYADLLFEGVVCGETMTPGIIVYGVLRMPPLDVQ
jgi:hypothetical protein